MAQELDVKGVALALGSTSAALYIICAALFAIVPSQTLTLFNLFFHGIDITQIARESVPFTEVVAGFVLTTLSGTAVGALFAKLYNYFLAK